MNYLFSNTTFLTKQIIKEYLHFWFFRILKNKLIILVIITVLTVISFLPPLAYMITIISILFIPLLILTMTYIFYPFVKNNKDHVEYFFEETNIKVNQYQNGLSSNLSLDYNMLTAISETKNLFIIDIDPSLKIDNYVLLISKNDFFKGTTSEFKSFILSKIKLP